MSKTRSGKIINIVVKETEDSLDHINDEGGHRYWSKRHLGEGFLTADGGSLKMWQELRSFLPLTIQIG